MNKIYEGLNKIRSKYSLGIYLDLKKGFDRDTETEILGPLLFLLYINDLPLATSFFFTKFADDTSFLISSRDIESLILSANTEPKKASQWIKANRLILHVSKTWFLEISPCL